MTLELLRELKWFRKIEPSTAFRAREGKSMLGRIVRLTTVSLRNNVFINPVTAPPFVFYGMIRLVKRQVLKNSNLGQFLKYWEIAIC
tara:strand:+ start:8898 stop:9158 length:261 start_codon:yes stop_codon:yes gene_type:complete